MSKKISDLKTRLNYALNIREKRSVDLVRDLNIPKSAISQYLSGKSQNMDSKRLYDVCRYLDVSEPWLLGYDVPMENTIKKSGTIADAALRMKNDSEFMSLMEMLLPLDNEKLNDVKQLVSMFLK